VVNILSAALVSKHYSYIADIVGRER